MKDRQAFILRKDSVGSVAVFALCLLALATFGVCARANDFANSMFRKPHFLPSAPETAVGFESWRDPYPAMFTVLPSDPSSENDPQLVANSAQQVRNVKSYEEKAGPGRPRMVWHAGVGDDGRCLLHSTQAWYYQDGQLQNQVTHALGQKTGREVLHGSEGARTRKWMHRDDETSVWTEFWPNGPAMAESHWRGMFAEGLAIRLNPDGRALSRVVFAGGKLSGEPGKVAPSTPPSVVGYSDSPTNPAMRPIQDVPGLPRVLLIGDSISIGYTLAVRERLAGKANVHRIPENGGPTTNGLAKLDAWLGTQRWDVIHFNWGLHDMKIMASGQQKVPLAEYELNLEQLVQRLGQCGARLIWATTTPVPEGNLGTTRRSADVLRYNETARKVVQKHGIPVNDLYAFALPQLSKLQIQENVHFTTEGSSVLAQPVAKAILTALAKH